MTDPIRELLGKIMGYAPACVESDGSKPPGGLLAAVAVVVLVVSSAAAPVAGQPAGMVGIPDANVQGDLPADTEETLTASDLEGSVMASRHASTLEVVVTNQERAPTYLEANGTRVGTGGDGLALVLRDDEHDAGRKVALPADGVKETLGYLPETVYGRHDDGTQWRRQIDAGGGLLTFEVPHFSNNTVTFSGGVSISATPAQDGSSYTYSMSDVDSVENFSVQFTGTETTETDSFTVDKGESASSTIAGDEDPSAADVAVHWKLNDVDIGKSDLDTGSCGATGWCFGQDGQYSNSWSSPSDPNQITVTYYIDEFDSVDGTLTDGNGNTLASWSGVSHSGSGYTEITKSADLSADQNLNNLQFTTDGSGYLQGITIDAEGPDSVDVTVDGTTETWNSQATKSVPLDGDDSVDVSVSATGGEGVSATTSYEETSYSPNPSVEVNGEVMSYPGTLAPGEKATVKPPTGAVESSNIVNVSLGESADAPTPSVEIEYAHDAVDEQSVSYESETWSERYNFSRYYASERDSASVTIPFKSDVLAVREVKYRTNGGSWVEVNDYTLQNTTLTAQIGHVSAGSTVTVVATGSRVDARDGSIQVTEPTTSGDTLATEFKIESAGENFRIDVSGTEEAQYLHYVTNESWTAPAEYSIVRSDGQTLYLPEASAGSTATARSYPMEVHPQNDVRVRLVEPGDTPEFDVGPGEVEGDEVQFVLYGAASGEEYKLESLEDGKIWDKGTANSPVTLTMEDDQSDSLLIGLVNSLGGSGGGGGGGGGAAPLSSTGAGNPLVPPWVMLGLGAGVLLLGGVVVSRAGVPVWVYGPVAALVGLVTVETLAPGAVSYTFASVGRLAGAEVSAVLGEVGAPILLAGAALLLWGAYRVIRRLTRRQNVTLRLRRRS